MNCIRFEAFAAERHFFIGSPKRLRVALTQARKGRLHILGEMAKAITTAHAELGEHAPRIEVLTIPTTRQPAAWRRITIR